MDPYIHKLMKSNYKKLIQIEPNIETIKEARKLKAPGFMDLGIDILIDKENYRYIALSHYYKHPSGDMIPDPDMELRIIKGAETVEAMTYQDMYRYDQVYDEGREPNEKLRRSLNEFLDMWLSNIIAQGHKS